MKKGRKEIKEGRKEEGKERNGTRKGKNGMKEGEEGGNRERKEKGKEKGKEMGREEGILFSSFLVADNTAWPGWTSEGETRCSLIVSLKCSQFSSGEPLRVPIKIGDDQLHPHIL